MFTHAEAEDDGVASQQREGLKPRRAHGSRTSHDQPSRVDEERVAARRVSEEAAQDAREDVDDADDAEQVGARLVVGSGRNRVVDDVVKRHEEACTNIQT